MRKMMSEGKRLSRRLLAIASMVPEHSKVADIGCDHGFVSIYLCEQKIADRVIAMDANIGPLEKAKKHVQDANFSTSIECRLSDGLEKLEPGEVDTLLIGGMGGLLMISILSAKPDLLDRTDHLILQPQSEIGKVRKFIHNHYFCIQEERMVFEEGKYYTVIHAVQGEQHFEKEEEYLYGNDLIKKKDPILREYLVYECVTYEKILLNLRPQKSDKAKARKKEIIRILESIKELQKFMST